MEAPGLKLEVELELWKDEIWFEEIDCESMLTKTADVVEGSIKRKVRKEFEIEEVVALISAEERDKEDRVIIEMTDCVEVVRGYKKELEG